MEQLSSLELRLAGEHGRQLQLNRRDRSSRPLHAGTLNRQKAAAYGAIGGDETCNISIAELLTTLSEPCSGNAWQSALSALLPHSAVEGSGSPLAYINVGAIKATTLQNSLASGVRPR